MTKGNYWDDGDETTLCIEPYTGAICISTTDSRQFHSDEIGEEFHITDEAMLDQIIAWLEKMRPVLKERDK